MSLNGVKLNGVSLMVVSLNGVKLNGVKFNGVKLTFRRAYQPTGPGRMVSYAAPVRSARLGMKPIQYGGV
jgi:uncharacterized protein YjbI with pentapeptide repeats